MDIYIGCLAFFVIDLGRPDRAGNIIFIGYPNGRLAQSWMDWGVLFLSGMVIWGGIIYLAITYIPSLARAVLGKYIRPTQIVLDYLIMLTGIAATVYTAFLFAAAGGKSYWWNGVLPPLLWLSSGLAYGSAFSLLVTRFFEKSVTTAVPVKADGGTSELAHVLHELSWLDLLAEIFEGFGWALFIAWPWRITT